VIDPTLSPDGQHVAYVRNNNLFVYDLHSRQEQAITTDGTDLKSYGTAEFVAQEEMGRTSGLLVAARQPDHCLPGQR